jgi:hypothetical protein
MDNDILLMKAKQDQEYLGFPHHMGRQRRNCFMMRFATARMYGQYGARHNLFQAPQSSTFNASMDPTAQKA